MAFMSIRSAVLAATILAALSSASAKGRAYYGPSNLGPFRIDRDVSMRSLFDRLGIPAKKARDSFCYRSQQSDTFLILTRMADSYDERVAGGITISDFPNCLDLPVQITNDDLAGWKTEKGIGIGSTRGEVVAAYGKPSFVEAITGNDFRGLIRGSSPGHSGVARRKIGDTSLNYRGADDELKSTFFGIRDGKVVWIFMSDNE